MPHNRQERVCTHWHYWVTVVDLHLPSHYGRLCYEVLVPEDGIRRYEFAFLM
jgi:hypothetical protein